MARKLKEMRRNYKMFDLNEKDMSGDPYDQFERWLLEALSSKVVEPNAMSFSTVSKDGRPSSRMVLLKDFSKKGFVFYTNYLSRKGKELEDNPQVALLFFWDQLERQVRVEGKVRKVSAKQSDNYFNSRPWESQIAAIISPQSQVIPDRKYVENAVKAYVDPDQKICRPKHWGGYLVIPDVFEFWQGRKNRLHDRIRYTRSARQWTIERLAP